MSAKKNIFWVIVGVAITLGAIFGYNYLLGEKLELAAVRITPNETPPRSPCFLSITVNNTGNTHIKNVSLTFETVPGVDVLSEGQLLNFSEENGKVVYTKDLGPLEANGEKNVVYVVTGTLHTDENRRLYSIIINVFADGEKKDTGTIEFVVTG